ncbi:hypothetical protein Tco_0053538 [Tanacetum coccineum]
MQTRSSSKFIGEPSTNSTSTNPKRRNRRRSKQRVEPFALEEVLVVTMADQRTMAELLRAPIEGYAEADLLRACPHHGFTELHQLDTFYNGLNPSDQDSLNSAVGGNLLERNAQDVLKIIENKSKVRNSRNKPIVSQVKTGNVDSSEIASAVARRCDLCDDPRNEMQATMSNQTNELKNMMASFFQMNTASSSGSGPLPSNTIANPKGELKAITTRSGIVLDGPSVLMPPPFINPEEDERVEETLTDPELVEYTIKVPPPLVQKPQAPSQKSYEMPKRDPLHPNIPYPSRMNKEKQQDKDEIQIHKFWQMFKQLHINISLADALILIPKYQKMLKALLSNKEKLLELANTPLNENCSAVILKKLPEKLCRPWEIIHFV